MKENCGWWNIAFKLCTKSNTSHRELYVNHVRYIFQVLSEDEAKRTVAAAIRLQAGRFDASPLYIPPSVTIQLPTSTSFPTSSDDVTGSVTSAHSNISEQSAESASQSLSTPHTAHTGVQTKTHAPALQAPESAPKNQRLRLTYWALDTALSAIFKGPNPRLGRPSARSKVRTILF